MKTDMTAAQHSLEWPWVEPEDSAQAMVELIKEDTYANNSCIDFLDDNLADRFKASRAPSEASSGPQPDTPPRDAAATTVSAFSPSEPALAAAAAAAPARRRKCLITRIEAFSSSHTLENCTW